MEWKAKGKLKKLKYRFHKGTMLMGCIIHSFEISLRLSFFFPSLFIHYSVARCLCRASKIPEDNTHL